MNQSQKLASTSKSKSTSISSNVIFSVGLLVGVFFTLPVFAANEDSGAPKFKQFGDYTIHFNAFSSDTLQPKIAKIYGITRSKNRGVLSISILKKTLDPMGKPIKAKVTALANNLTGQMKTIPIREIDDGGSIYYISEFRVAHKELLNFTVEATPIGADKPMVIKFRQQFYTN